MSSCNRFIGNSKEVSKPTQVVDFPSMVGKSLQEMTVILGQATPQVNCYKWELREGKLIVCYETGDYAKKWMSSITYELKPSLDSAPDIAVGSPEEMMALININVQGKKAKEDRRKFFTYNDIEVNGKSCFIDVYRRKTKFIFSQPEQSFITAKLFLRNPKIKIYSSVNHEEKETTFFEQQTNVNVSIGSVLLSQGNWEVCTEENFTGKCRILDGIDRTYLENNKNFSEFGLGNTIKSLRPVKLR